MKALTREQKEYIELKKAFEGMHKHYSEYREKVKCCELNLKNKKESTYTIENVFYNLLDKHKNK